MRKKLRFNAVLASLFLFLPAMLAVMYGASFLAVYWTLGNYMVALASFGGGLALAILCVGLWLRIVMKMKAKLKALDDKIPLNDVAA